MKKLFFKTFFAIVATSFCVTPSLKAERTQAPVKKEMQKKQNGSKWQEFKAEDSGFSITFPTKPDHIQQSIDVPNTNLQIKYDTYVSEPNDSAVFVVSVWHYPSEIDMSHPEVNLQDGFGGMLSALPGSKVMKMEMTKIQGFNALEFLVKNEDIYFQGKLILVYNTLYQVFTVYRDNIDMSDDYKQFIDSFKLINPDMNKVKPQKSARNLNV